MKAATAIVGLLLLVLSGCKGASGNKPTIYVIENGGSGWVRIFYDRQDEKELPIENGSPVAHVGPDLKLFTRSPMNPSWDGSKFYYQGPDGKRVPLSPEPGPAHRIWAEEKNNDDNGHWETFFIGDQDQFSKGLQPGAVDGIMHPSND